LDRADEIISDLINKQHESRVKQQVREARLTADRASIAALKFNYLAAAKYYGTAVELLPTQDYPEASEWLSAAGKNFYLGKDYTDAVVLLRRALVIDEKRLIPEDPNLLSVKRVLAMSLASNHQWAESVQIFRQIVHLEAEAGSDPGRLALDYFFLGSGLF